MSYHTWHGIDNPDLATRLYDAFWAAYDQLDMEKYGRVTGGYRSIGIYRADCLLAMISRTARGGYPLRLWQLMAEMLESSFPACVGSWDELGLPAGSERPGENYPSGGNDP